MLNHVTMKSFIFCIMCNISAGPVQRMDPLSNLQVAIKNNIDVFYFGCVVPLHVYFVEDGEMGKLYIFFYVLVS